MYMKVDGKVNIINYGEQNYIGRLAIMQSRISPYEIGFHSKEPV